MKIILVSPIPPPAGGIATWTKMLLDSKQCSENDVQLVNTAVIGNRTKNLKKKNILSELKRTYSILSNLKRKLKNTESAIIHLNCPCSKTGLIRDYLCAKIAKKNRKNKLVVHYRCDVTYMVKGKIALFFFKKLTKKADKIITLNEVSKKYINDILNIDSVILPNFIDDNNFELNTESSISEKIGVILYAGHVTKQKGCDTIIEIAKELPQIEFRLVGYISDEIKNIPRTENVKLLGEMSKEETLMEMKKADIFLFPTHTEGFPNVVVEAMASGLPVISTTVGAIPDMLEEHGGILINDFNSRKYVEAIKNLQDKKIRKEISEWNKNKVKRCYIKDEVINQLFEIYGELEERK